MTVELDLSEVQRWGGLLASEQEDIVSRLTSAVAAEQAVVEQRARTAAPRRTGTLAGTIRRTGRGLTRRVKAGTARVYYPLFVDRGTSKMAARPFLLGQADSSTHAEFEGRVRRALDNGPIYR